MTATVLNQKPRPMGSTLFRDRSNTLTALGSLQHRALNRIDPLDSVSNYYLVLDTPHGKIHEVESKLGVDDLMGVE